MILVLVILTSWILLISLIVALCLAARVGDRHQQPALLASSSSPSSAQGDARRGQFHDRARREEERLVAAGN